MGTGGARAGAGRPRAHTKVENCLSIDVQCWQREGRLRLSERDQWDSGYLVCGTTISSVRYRVDAYFDGLIVALAYPTGERGVIDRVRVDRTPCTFGGSRSWFRCSTCDRRTAKIYFRGGHFACRTCQKLVYESQSQDAIQRGWRRQQRLERRLAGGRHRPKGMHARTYARILAGVDTCHAQRTQKTSSAKMRLLQS